MCSTTPEKVLQTGSLRSAHWHNTHTIEKLARMSSQSAPLSLYCPHCGEDFASRTVVVVTLPSCSHTSCQSCVCLPDGLICPVGCPVPPGTQPIINTTIKKYAVEVQRASSSSGRAVGGDSEAELGDGVVVEADDGPECVACKADGIKTPACVVCTTCSPEKPFCAEDGERHRARFPLHAQAYLVGPGARRVAASDCKEHPDVPAMYHVKSRALVCPVCDGAAAGEAVGEGKAVAILANPVPPGCVPVDDHLTYELGREIIQLDQRCKALVRQIDGYLAETTEVRQLLVQGTSALGQFIMRALDRVKDSRLKPLDAQIAELTVTLGQLQLYSDVCCALTKAHNPRDMAEAMPFLDKITPMLQYRYQGPASSSTLQLCFDVFNADDPAAQRVLDEAGVVRPLWAALLRCVTEVLFSFTQAQGEHPWQAIPVASLLAQLVCAGIRCGH